MSELIPKITINASHIIRHWLAHIHWLWPWPLSLLKAPGGAWHPNMFHCWELNLARIRKHPAYVPMSPLPVSDSSQCVSVIFGPRDICRNSLHWALGFAAILIPSHPWFSWTKAALFSSAEDRFEALRYEGTSACFNQKTNVGWWRWWSLSMIVFFE